MKSKLVKSAFILTFGVMISKAIGVFYRIPLSNILGAEGVGMYQLVFSVYALIVTIIGSGLPIAISRLTAEEIGRSGSSKNVIFPSMLIGLSVGLVLSVIVYAMSSLISKLQGNNLVSVCYKVISPAIFFVSGLSVLKGYFQGSVNMLPTSISYIIEQSVKLFVGLGLAIYFAKISIIKAVIGSLIGVTISEVVAFFVLILMYVKKRDKSKVDVKRSIPFVKNIVKIAFPITIGSALIPTSQFLDSFLVVNILSKSMQITDATALYGLYSGSVNPIVNMPIMLVLSLAMIIIPVVSKERVNLDYNGILAKSKFCIKLCFIVGIPCSILLFVFSYDLVKLVYPAFSQKEIQVATNLLKVASFSVVFYGTMQIETSLMQGLDRIYKPIKNLLIALVVKEIFCGVLVSSYGIIGLSYATLSLSVVACLLNSISYQRLLGKNLKITGGLWQALVCGFIFFAITIYIRQYVFNNILGFLLASIVGGSIYYILLRYNNVISKSELSSLGINSYKTSFLKNISRSRYDYSNRCRKG